MLLTAKEFEESKNYWLDQLSGELSETRLPRDFPAETQHNSANANIKVDFQHERAQTLTAISKNNDLSLYVILLASFKLVLYKYTAQTDIIVSSPIFNKESQEYNKWIALRDFPDSQATFKDLLLQVKQTVSGAYKNQHYPIRRLIELLNIGKELSLFRVVLILENLQDRTFISDIIGDFETDLMFVVNRQEEYTALEANIFYNPHLFKKETIQSLANRYFYILDQVLADVNLKITDVRFISEQESSQLLYEFNQTQTPYPRDRVIHELFEQQTERTPENAAVIGMAHYAQRTTRSVKHLTYSQLNERANQLAGLLRTKGVKPDTIVGIMMERSIEMVIGLLAISKAGGAYLPIDPAYPDDRLWFMIEDSGLHVLLTQKDFAHRNEKIDRVLADEGSNYSGEKGNPEITNQPGDLFYVIYTSGSTGRPKGVLINHGSFVNLVYFHRQVFKEDNRCLMSQVAGVSFDAMAFEIWPCLLSGAGLCIVDNDTRIDPAAMKEWLIKNQITISFQPTMMVERLLREEWPEHRVPLRALRAAGDQLLSYPQHAYPFRLYNLYGPTEDTVWTTWAEVPVTKATRTKPVIGKPTGNKTVYIIGQDNQLQPPGVPGELGISGSGLARGYLNRPGLTRERFCLRRPGGRFLRKLPREASGHPRKNFLLEGTRGLAPLLYRTGDLARWLPGGNLEFLGRVDFQVKIRGFRIEPGEIEHQLLQHPRVRETIVIIKEDNRGDKHLCAYIVSNPEPVEAPNAAGLKEYLSHRLPGYMIPSFFVHLEEIPLTPNGKVDRGALPEPVIKTGVEYAPPTNEMETRLVKIWTGVLGRTSIGIDDNFFELGGHSLKATLLVSKIHKEFNIKLPLLKIFNQPTVSQLARMIQRIAGPGHGYAFIEPAAKKEYYPLSSAQKRLKVLQQMDSEATVYNLPVFFILEGTIDRARLNQVFMKLIHRHESLRTSFHMVDNEPVQKVHDKVEFKVEEEEAPFGQILNAFGDRSPKSQELRAKSFIYSFIRPFDLSRAPLLRAGLVRIEKDKHLFMFDMHHIICDGISNQLLVQDFMALYEGKELPTLRIQYKDFSQWQNIEKEKKSIKQQENYWLKEFAGDIPVLQLPADYPRPVFQDFEGCTVVFELDVEETRALKQLALQQEVTMHMVLLAIYTILLSKLSRQEDIVVGTPTAGRRHADLEPVIGMFVNMIALRNYPQGEQSFITFLENLKERIFEAFENQDYQFEDLVEKLDVRRDTGGNPLFDTVFVFQAIDIPELQIPGLKLKPYPYENTTSKFDLSLQSTEEDQHLEMIFEYRTRLFRSQTVERFTGYFKKLVSGILEDVKNPIGELEIITEAEKQQILFEFNTPISRYPKDKTLHGLFEQQVEKKPGYTVLVGNEEGGKDTWTMHLSYHELNEKSDQLAYQLKERGVEPDTIVGIMVERSAEIIIGILGILKAGGIYLPIDPDYPEERIKYMLKDSGAKILVTVPGLSEKFEKLLIVNCQLLMVNEKQPVRRRPNTPPKEANSINNYQLTINNLQLKRANLAYILYTSGTTGRPKGAVILHRNVVSLMFNDNYLFDFNSDDVWTMFHSYCFDFSVWEMYGALLYGGKLVLIPGLTARDPQTFLEILKKEKVTVLNQTPKSFYNLAHLEIKDPAAQLKLKYIIFGGDTLAPAKLKEWKEKYPGTRLINMFGITETTVHVTYKEIQNKDIRFGISNIGKPIPALNTYVVDPYLNLVPIGVPGELCVQGGGVGRGYLNNPDLTNDKFRRAVTSHSSLIFSSSKLFPNDQCPMTNDRLYKSGDLVKLLDNGEMEYLGRIDHQVKIRGYRIELGEIQSQLLNHDQIADTVVIEKEDRSGDKYLCAYIVTADAAALEKVPGTAELREYLSRILPDYMIPAYFVRLDKIPLTPNGKLDRNALPEPGHMGPAHDGEYAAPRDAVEIALARTWKQVLGRDLIGINENFFAIGGDSIKSIQMASRMNEAGYKVDIRDIFQHPSIRDLAPLVKKARRIPPQSPITGIVSLTPIQHWFFQAQSGSPSIHHYNQAVLLRGKTDDRWDEKSLEAVLQKLQQHHDALRMTYQIKEGKTLQTGHGPDYPVWLEVVDLRGYEYSGAVKRMTAKAYEIQAGIHMEKGPLMKTALFRLEDGDRLLMVIHHLVVDGLSWRILFEDIQTLYRQQQKGESLKLPAKTDSYQAWAERLIHYANSETFLKERPYWETLETTMVPPIKRDFPAVDDPNLVQDTAEVSFELDERETDLLLTTVNHAFGTEINDILLTGLGLALKQTFGVHRLLIALEGHGRETIIADEDIDISRTVGWFTTIYPVLLDMSYENDPGRQVKEIKETLRKVPHKGIGYGILKYLTINEHKEIDFSITPRVSFNYLGQFDADVERMSFSLAREPVGQLMAVQTRRSFDLDITGMIVKKRLLMSITYNRQHYRTKTLETLAHHFQTAMSQIISYCTARPDRELTPSDFTYKGLSIETVHQLISQYDIEDLYLLSPMQEGMLFHALYDNASAGYFEQISYTLEGEVDENLIEQSINQLIRRHPTLRTLFLYQGFERPIQLVLKEKKTEFYYQDLRDLEEEHEIQTFVREFKERDRQRLFDVSKDTLMRAALFRADINRYELTWSLHHIIMDGWCLSIVDNEFSEIYQSLKENRAPRLEPVTPYSRYIRWMETQDSQAAENYWRRYLEGYEQPASLPKKSLTAEYDYTTEHVVLELTAEELKGLKQLSGKYQVTMNTLIRVIWGILLAKYNGRQDVVFGAVVSGRPPDIEGVNMIIGLFINTIPVRIRFDKKTTFVRLIKDVQVRAVESEHYHYYPLASIQADHPLKQQLLDHLFTFQNYQRSEDIVQLSGKTHLKKETAGNRLLNLRNSEAFERTNYDFNILVIPGETLKMIFQYNSSVHENSMVSKLVRQLKDIMDQVLSSETIEINEIKISFDLVAVKPIYLQEDEDEFGF